VELVNLTPFAAETFRQLGKTGDFYGVVAVAGHFTLSSKGRLDWREDVPFLWEDSYRDDGFGSYLQEQSDFIPFKPGTDLTVLAAAWAPDEKPVSNFVCGLKIEGRLEKRLRVFGPRFWQRAKGPREEWRLSQPEPFISLPLMWSFASGGPLAPSGPDDAPGEVDPDNPWGMGRVDLSKADKTEDRFPASRIIPFDAPPEDWRIKTMPQAFAPLPPVSQLRLQHAGTYDEAWLATRHPQLPEDFDPAFWQCAHPDLILLPYLKGQEILTLGRLHRIFPVLTVALPGLCPVMRLHWPQGYEDEPLVLDGVHLDCRGETVKAKLTWRRAFALRGREELRIVLRATDRTGARWAWRTSRPKG
jgi:hypothetical protein